VQVIEWHFDPAGSSQPQAALLNLAARLASDLGFGLPGEAAHLLDPAGSADAAGFGRQQLGGIVSRAVGAFDRINRALG
jgi:hypothetical protein